MKFAFSVTFIFLVLIVSFLLMQKSVIAQSCSGTFECGDVVGHCTYPDGVTLCGDCSPNNTPGCLNTFLCDPPVGGLTRSCAGGGGITACSAYGCGVGSCVLGDYCSSGSGGGSTCDASNCFNRSCTDGSGNTCSCYGQCFSGTCGDGSIIPGTCSGGATPTATPPPGGVCTPGDYCSGTACTGCGTGIDTYCGGSGQCDDARVVSGAFCNTCANCAAGQGACPPPVGGATDTPAPTGGANCTPGVSFNCGATCCANGDTCTGAGSCIPAGGFPTLPPPPPPTLSGKVFYDRNGNGSQDVGDSNASNILVTAFGCSGGGSCESPNTDSDNSGNYTINLSSPFYASINYTVRTVIFGGGYIEIPSSYTASAGSSNLDFGLWQGNIINATIYKDIDGDGVQDAGETGYQNASINVSTGNCGDGLDNDGDTRIDTNDSRCHSDNNANNSATYSAGRAENGNSTTSANYTTNSSGLSSASPLNNGTWQVYLNTVPSGYILTTSRVTKLAVSGGNTYVTKVGIQLPAPSCPGGLSANPLVVNPGGTSTLSVTSCTNVPVAPPSPFVWIPDNPPGAHNPPPTIGGQTDTPTSSTTTWTAPACPTASATYNPRVTVGSGSNTTSYTTGITVPATYTVGANVRAVTTIGTCDATTGVAYNDGSGNGANLNITDGSTVNQNQTTNGVTGATSFTCLPSGSNYQVSLSVPSGYSVVGINGGSALGSNGITVNNLSSNTTVTFCIAPLDPWFQTSQGDVRFLNLLNPVPTGQYGSTDATYPGIFYSSDSNADLGVGTASVRNWVINNEYSYNADTENRNGGMSYDFYKAKTKQDGVTITPISSGTFDQSQITQSGVYESAGDLTINLYTHVNGRRVVILVNGNVTINASTIAIAQNQGIFIVAAKGNITIARTVGTATLTSSTSNIDGYYTAQGSIILDGDSCSDGTTPDLRLNVGGALVANSLKPFATTGTGTLQNRRSLCTSNLLYPSLYINSRPDFLTQLTDFYKTSYTKWQEVNP